MRQIDRDFIKIQAWSVLVIRLLAVYVAIEFVLLQISNYFMMVFLGWNPYEPNFGATAGIALISTVIAVALWRGAPFLTRKVFSDFTGTCPKCRFDLESFRADRCPECGLYLGEDFHAPPPPQITDTPSATDPAKTGQFDGEEQQH